PGDEIGEPLAVLAISLVAVDDASDSLRYALGGYLFGDALGVVEVVVLVASAHVDLVGRHHVPALGGNGRALETDVADVVTTASVRAATDLHVHEPDQWILIGMHLVQRLPDGLVHSH